MEPRKITLYKDSSASDDARTEDLISRMSIEEKLAQMQCHWETKKESLLDQHGNFDSSKAKKYFSSGHGLGQIGRPSDSGTGKNAIEMAELTNQIQKFFIENSRLGIPVFFHEECLHGHAAMDGTSFPQPIALACTFNTDLVKKVYEHTAEEARVRGTHQALTPVVDVAREPRWGRVEETFGEDPFLVSRMGLAAVKGFQGDNTYKDKKHIVATLKHFAAHGQPESGNNCAPANISERILRETFLYPFKIAVEKGKVGSLMASYNEIDGVPSHANKWLLRDVLRNEWGFEGYVVSDYYGIRELYERPGVYGHYVATSRSDAARLAVEAGVNIEFPEPDCYTFLIDLVKTGEIREEQINNLIRPLLACKFKMGLFDDPYVNPEIAVKTAGSDKNREIALQAARESIVLLQNKNKLAPLHDVRSIAIIGPNADREMLGGYSGVPKHHITVRQGVEDAAKEAGIECRYAEGCKITVGGSWIEDEVVLADPDEDDKLIREATEIAKGTDAIILVIGGNEQTSREAWDKIHKGDRTDLKLVGQQNKLVDELSQLGIPIISVLFNGRPLAINNLVEKSDAIFECFYLGQESGRAVADVIFGKYNPGGKLSISIPRSVGHLPCYYNYRPSARRSYLFDDVSALFPFGHGLSYTEFSLSDLHLNKTEMRADEIAELSVNITNTGDTEGDEVVQLYIRDEFSSVTRPVMELKDFKRVRLLPGQIKKVSFMIDADKLAFYNINYEYAVEKGAFLLKLGTSSGDDAFLETALTVI